jgi:superfamily II DNA/RNA helicase
MSSYKSTNYRTSNTMGGYRGSRPKYGQRNSNKPKHGQYIDPARFIKLAAPVIEAEKYVATNKFEDFDINPLLKRNLAANGYSEPTPIQDQTIPAALAGRDVIGVAHTGTGKTAAFAVPILHELLTDRDKRVLVMAPTRELAQQIEAEFIKICRGGGLRGAVLIGGSSMGRQLGDLRYNPQIVIGTPGRIKDHVERRSLNLATFNIVVLDEVDRMLDMGFINDMRTILGQLDSSKQSYFFSATLDAKVRDLAGTFANDPVTIMLKTSETSANINQDVVKYISPHDKLDKLHDTLIKGEVEKVIVFEETKHGADRLGKELVLRGFKAASIHGGKSQGQRQRALKQFKENQVNVLVATDVAARGIDVIDITHVINYSIPHTYEDYVHRIGRAGRAGRAGHALTFISGA